MYLSTNILTNSAIMTAVASTVGTNAVVHTVNVINWTVIGGIAATLIPIVIAAVAVIIKLYGEKTKIAESVLRESPVIQGLQNDIDTGIENLQATTDHNIDNLSERINTNISQITENIKEANHARETFRSETTRTLETQRQNLDELKNLVFTMRSDLEILKNENERQNKSIEELRDDNKELVTRLENLIKELYEYLNTSG